MTVVLAFTLHCQRSFALAVLTTMRGHSSESDFFTRRATEMAAMARLVAADPDQAQKWASAAHGDDHYRDYQRAFQSRTLFPKGDASMQRLYDAYDQCSKRCHPSVYGIGDNMTMEALDNSVRVQVHHLSDPEGEGIGTSVIWISRMHLTVLDVLAEAAEVSTSRKGANWDAMRAKLELEIVKASAFLDREDNGETAE